MSRYGFLGIAITIVVAAIAGVIGYNVGLSAGLATNGTTPVVYAPGFGFGGFGLVLGILLIVVLVGAFRRAAWRGPRGGHGGPWGGGHGFGPGDAMFQEWHRRAHGEAPRPETAGATPPDR